MVFVSWLQARRTVAKYEFGAFRSTKKERLWIRPTFRLENGELIREPAADFDRFMRTQETLIQQNFGGGRVHRRTPPLLTVSFVRLFGSEIRQFFHPVDPLAPLPERGPTVDVPATIALNLRIIQELGHQIAAAGATFVVADASVYFEDDGTFSRPLAALCAREGFRYLPVSEDLLAANRRGIATHWKYDLHFNEAGNRILAEALSDWIDRHPPTLAAANGPLR